MLLQAGCWKGRRLVYRQPHGLVPAQSTLGGHWLWRFTNTQVAVFGRRNNESGMFGHLEQETARRPGNRHADERVRTHAPSLSSLSLSNTHTHTHTLSLSLSLFLNSSMAFCLWPEDESRWADQDFADLVSPPGSEVVLSWLGPSASCPGADSDRRN